MPKQLLCRKPTEYGLCTLPYEHPENQGCYCGDEPVLGYAAYAGWIRTHWLKPTFSEDETKKLWKREPDSMKEKWIIIAQAVMNAAVRLSTGDES